MTTTDSTSPTWEGLRLIARVFGLEINPCEDPTCPVCPKTEETAEQTGQAEETTANVSPPEKGYLVSYKVYAGTSAVGEEYRTVRKFFTDEFEATDFIVNRRPTMDMEIMEVFYKIGQPLTLKVPEPWLGPISDGCPL